MAEAALVLAALQVVTPVAVATMPAIWRQIEEGLRWVKARMAGERRHQDIHLVCIMTILDTLDRLPNHSWISESQSQALFNHMKDRTESLRTMIENDNAIMRFFHRGKFVKDIQLIAVMMQLLETNVRARLTDTSVQYNANRDVNTNRLDLHFYKESQENLVDDLLVILRADDLKPVVVETRENYEASVGKSSTYPRIRYEFPPEGALSGNYPRTLAVSKGVRECIELLLKKLRDLKLMQETQNAGGLEFVGIALCDFFTEILPKVLMAHLNECRSTLLPHTAQQFSKNLRFLRSFSISSTFKAIQGADGLRLDKVWEIDLRESAWLAWEDVQKMSLEVGTSQGRITTTPSGNIESHECTLCGAYIAATSLGQHWEACFRREERFHSWRRSPQRCPVCHEDVDHMSEEERDLHANACLDKN